MVMIQNMSRRTFLKTTQVVSGGLILGWPTSKIVANTADSDVVFAPNGFLQISSDGQVIIFAKNPEIGQGVKTSLPMIIAEELEVAWESVMVRQANYNRDLGAQFAGGSTAIKTNYEALRKAGAAARMMLVGAAAQQWECRIADCHASQGVVFHRDGRKYSYGALAETAATLDVPKEITLKSPDDFTIIGTRQKTVDSALIVRGSAKFGMDNLVPGMLRAALVKCPVFGGRVGSLDDQMARATSGVVDVLIVPALDNPTTRMESVAVVAMDTWTALQAVKALEIEWKYDETHGSVSSKSLRKQMTEQLDSDDLTLLRSDGDTTQTLSDADNIVEAEYEVPFLSHATMEPMNYIADVRDDQIECWGPTQVPGAVSYYANQITGIDREKIQVHQTRVGGGFGRRLLADYASEAVYISHQLKKPVQIVWSREEDMQHGYYRPMGRYRLRGSLNDGGVINAWEIKAATTSRYLFRKDDDPPHKTELFPDGFPAGFVPNFSMKYGAVATHVPTGAWRAPGHNATCFVDQSFLDELVVSVGADPIAHRLQMLGEEDQLMPYDDHGGPTYSTARLRNVIQRVANLSSWEDAKASGRYLGFAAHFMFGSYVAEVAEVSLDQDGHIKIDKIFVSVDCGVVINQLGAEAQIEGGIIDGLGAAIYGGMSIQDGAATASNFHQYPMIRYSMAPQVIIDLVESSESPEGLGEISLPPIGAALCNAIYRATGHRIRELPIIKHDIAM